MTFRICAQNCRYSLFVSDYQSQRIVWIRAVSFVLVVGVISCFKAVDQLSLEMEPSFNDLDKYLKTFIGDHNQLTLLLDYDGTLAPIAAHPNLTCMSEATQKSLKRIAENPNIFTAVISGRAVDDVKKKIAIDGLIYAGNHGLEILYPNGTRYNHQIPGSVSGNFEKMVVALKQVRLSILISRISMNFVNSLRLLGTARGSRIKQCR